MPDYDDPEDIDGGALVMAESALDDCEYSAAAAAALVAIAYRLDDLARRHGAGRRDG